MLVHENLMKVEMIIFHKFVFWNEYSVAHWGDFNCKCVVFVRYVPPTLCHLQPILHFPFGLQTTEKSCSHPNSQKNLYYNSASFFMKTTRHVCAKSHTLSWHPVHSHYIKTFIHLPLCLLWTEKYCHYTQHGQNNKRHTEIKSWYTFYCYLHIWFAFSATLWYTYRQLCFQFHRPLHCHCMVLGHFMSETNHRWSPFTSHLGGLTNMSLEMYVFNEVAISGSHWSSESKLQWFWSSDQNVTAIKITWVKTLFLQGIQNK